MPDITIRIEGGERLQQVMGNAQFIRGPLKTFLTRSAFIVELKEKEKAPVDTGRLRSSITTVLQPMKALVGPTVFYAPYVEYGTRPHWAPKGALQPWASRHGFPAGSLGDFLVRRAIAKRGTRAQPFMRPAAQASLPLIKGEFDQMVRDIRARWSGRAI